MAQTEKVTYRGTDFDLLIEAQWAVFFDWMNIAWRYHDIFLSVPTDSTGRACPSFYLPDLRYMILIDKTCDARYATRIAEVSGMETFVFEPMMYVPSSYSDIVSADEYCPEGYVDNFQMWCECPDCGRLGIRFDARSDRLPCKGRKLVGMAIEQTGIGCPTHGGNGDKGYNGDSPRLVAAYQAAVDFGVMWESTHSTPATQAAGST